MKALNKLYDLNKIAFAVAIVMGSAWATPASALHIIPHFTTGYLEQDAKGNWNPVNCSTDPSHPTPPPTGNIFEPFSNALGIPGNILSTSCMTPDEMASVNQAISNIEYVVADDITVDIEYFDSPLLAQIAPGALNEPFIYTIESNDPVHHPEAAYNALRDRLQAKHALNLLNNANLGEIFSVNATALLPSYDQISVLYPQVDTYAIESNYFNNNPIYAQTITIGTQNFDPSVTKPQSMAIWGSAHLNMLTNNGRNPLPGVNVNLYIPNQYISTLPNVNGAVVNGLMGAEFYSETDPSFIAQQKLVPSLLSAGYLILAIEALLNGNYTLMNPPVFPPNYNPSFDLVAIMTHETLEELGKDSAINQGLYPLILQTAMTTMDMYEVPLSKAKLINSPQSYVNTPRLVQYNGDPLADGNVAEPHVLLYHVGILPNDTSKYLGECGGVGDFGDYDDFSVPIYLSNGDPATYQLSYNSPPTFYDNFGNILESAQDNGGFPGIIQPLSIQELIELEALGYELKNVNSVVGNTCKAAPNPDGSCNLKDLQKINLSTW